MPMTAALTWAEVAACVRMLGRARERFLGAYANGLRRAGSAIMLDLDLLDAFEVAKETYEFVYAATVLPSWLWAPREGMRWLLAHGEDR